MSLDGLRAWIGEVERKLGARTRVFLVLVAIAVGGSGAAIYLALEADDGGGGSGGASVEEVEALRTQLESQGSESTQVSALEAQIVELRTEIEDLKAGGGQGGSGGNSGTEGSGGEAAKKIPESEVEK
jgi:hypothetical protein